MIRVLIIFFLTMVLQACITSFDDITNLARNQIFGYAEPVITAKDIDDSRFSFMIIRAGNGPYARMILNSYNEGTYEWISTDNERIYTYKGLVVKTVNLKHNFEIKNYRKFNPQTSEEQHFIINLDNPKLIGAEISLQIKPAVELNLTDIHPSASRHILIKKIDSIGWETSNSVWFDENQEILKSSQYIHPFYKQLEFKVYLK